MAAQAADPLLVAYPSPLLLLQYPLFAVNVKLLCDKDIRTRVKGQSSIASTVNTLRWSYQAEGLLGLYRGVGIYFGHQAARDSLRLLAGGCYKLLGAERRQAVEKRLKTLDYGNGLFWLRWAAKYAIEVISYPLLLASTRTIILQFDPLSTLPQLRNWCRVEGPFSVFNGLTTSLLSTAMDEAMDAALSACIETAAGAEIEVADKLLLKASATSVLSIFTAPISYVGTIQRCQSAQLPGLLEPRSLSTILSGLPWQASFYQFLMFSGILALNVKLIQWKIAAQKEEDEEE